MPFAQEDLEQLRRLIREEVDARLPAGTVRYDLELRDRIVRVEEELKHQRELMEQGFRLMDRRFEEMRGDMNKRFEQVDKRLEQVDRRFEEMREDMNKRFEQVDKRFEQVEKRFELVDKRFEQMDKRFEQIIEYSEKRFAQIDTRFERLTERIDRFMRWSFALTLTVGGLVVAAIKYLP